MKNYSEADDIGLQNTKEHSLTSPKPALRLIDAIVLITGIVIGAGIFRSPSVVAANTVDGYWFLFVWVLDGIISLIGALCYSELSAAFPSTGGDYHFFKACIRKAFFIFICLGAYPHCTNRLYSLAGFYHWRLYVAGI